MPYDKLISIGSGWRRCLAYAVVAVCKVMTALDTPGQNPMLGGC